MRLPSARRPGRLPGGFVQRCCQRHERTCIEAIVGDLSDHDVYLCASPRLASRVRESLMDGGFPRRHLHEECFSF